MIGRIVGSYRIVEKIGEGGMGAVYRAVDEMLDREAAVKAIRPDLAREPQIAERFRSEARALARLNHPAVATIYSFFHDGEDLFLAMEFVRGRTLSRVLREDGALPWQRAVPLFLSPLDGIEQAHRTGVVHRDLKPDNLMLTETGTLKVMDFGIARVMGSGHLTRTGLLVGTLRYMAPEQIRGEEVDRRTDVYALGTVLYELLTGRTPFEGGSDYAVLRAQIEDTPAPLSASVTGLPDWIDQAVQKALAKDPAARFQTVSELHAFLAQHAGLALPPTHVQPAAPAPAPPAPAGPDMTRPDRGPIEQAPTVAATRAASLPTGTTPLPVSPAPTGVGSYRPMGRPATWQRTAAGAAVAVLLLLAVASAVLWMRRDRPAEVSAAGLPPPGEAVTPLTEPQPQAGNALSSPPVSPTPQPEPRRQEPPLPRIPQDRTTAPPRPTPTPEPREEVKAPAPTVEAAPPSPTPEVTETSTDAPAEELRQIAGELKTRSTQLYTLYETYLEQKENGGAELTEADGQLLDELENFEDAAASFNKQFQDGFLKRLRRRAPGDRTTLVRRGEQLAEKGRTVDRLMDQVQPSQEVRQAWQEVRSRWKRAAGIVTRFQ
ncbi:MAG TPA: protein kinase [Thermoanaerobaculia bacterium]|nr:protein kinase [Thermoanaerobaculia bacterium]